MEFISRRILEGVRVVTVLKPHWWVLASLIEINKNDLLACSIVLKVERLGAVC